MVCSSINKCDADSLLEGDISLAAYGDDNQHNVLAVLKLYMREMPEAIPSRFYSTFLRLMGVQTLANALHFHN